MSQKASKLFNNNSNGQSLIETIVAIFILTTALSAGVGLAIYAFGSSQVTLNEITATNLAREGVDVVHMMRDSNWLAGDSAGGANAMHVATSGADTCGDLGAGKACYPNAYSGPSFNIVSACVSNCRISLDSNNNWTLDSTVDYSLYLQPSGIYSTTVNGTATYARMINVTYNQISPCSPSCAVSNKEMVVKSVVAWKGKGCPTISFTSDLLAQGTTKCRTIVEEHLTNWKDYQ